MVAYLDRRRLSRRLIHDAIVPTLGPNIVGYITVTRGLRDAKFPLSTKEASDAEDRSPIDHVDEVMLSALSESPFASVRQLSRLPQLPLTTVYCRLTQSLGFTACHLRWLPLVLSDAQKAQRMTPPRQLLRMLEVSHGRVWRDVVTPDESWFCLTTVHEFIWLPHGASSGKVKQHQGRDRGRSRNVEGAVGRMQE
jgi:hypothetical protein